MDCINAESWLHLWSSTSTHSTEKHVAPCRSLNFTLKINLQYGYNIKIVEKSFDLQVLNFKLKNLNCKNNARFFLTFIFFYLYLICLYTL